MKGTLTNAGVRKLRPKGRTYEVTCSRLPGFVVRVLPSGRKVFLARHMVDGRDTRVRIGPWSEELTADEARQQALAILNGTTAPKVESAPVVRGPGRRAGRKTAPASRDVPRDTPRADERLGSEPSQSGDGTTIRELCERYEREFMTAYLKKSTATNGIRWKIQRGARWRDLPEEYGTPTTCWRWHKRGSKSGVWEQVLAKINK